MADEPEAAQTEELLIGEAVGTLRVFVGMVLFSFTKHSQALKDRTCCNFIARGMGCTENILSAWRAGTGQDAWILHRALLDRLIHLRHLADTDGFEAFEAHSFMSMYEMRHQLLSDPDMRHKAPESLKELQKADRPRYDALSQQPRWKRPRPAAVAKSMDLGFLYRFGYDYASTHVHPMARDGEGDFARLTSPTQTVAVGDATVVKNSLLIQSMWIQEHLNLSSRSWRAIVYDFLDQVKHFAGDGSLEMHRTLFKIGKVWPEFELCAPAGDGA